MQLPSEGTLTLLGTPEEAASGADFVQESAPERDGKVLLAFDAAALGRDLVRCTDRTTIDPDALARELDAVRQARLRGLRGRVRARARRVRRAGLGGLQCIAALCISGPRYRLDRPAAERLAPLCITSAGELERSLGNPLP